MERVLCIRLPMLLAQAVVANNRVSSVEPRHGSRLEAQEQLLRHGQADETEEIRARSASIKQPRLQKIHVTARDRHLDRSLKKSTQKTVGHSTRGGTVC